MTRLAKTVIPLTLLVGLVVLIWRVRLLRALVLGVAAGAALAVL